MTHSVPMATALQPAEAIKLEYSESDAENDFVNVTAAASSDDREVKESTESVITNFVEVKVRLLNMLKLQDVGKRAEYEERSGVYDLEYDSDDVDDVELSNESNARLRFLPHLHAEYEALAFNITHQKLGSCMGDPFSDVILATGYMYGSMAPSPAFATACWCLACLSFFLRLAFPKAISGFRVWLHAKLRDHLTVEHIPLVLGFCKHARMPASAEGRIIYDENTGKVVPLDAKLTRPDRPGFILQAVLSAFVLAAVVPLAIGPDPRGTAKFVFIASDAAFVIICIAAICLCQVKIYRAYRTVGDSDHKSCEPSSDDANQIWMSSTVPMLCLQLCIKINDGFKHLSHLGDVLLSGARGLSVQMLAAIMYIGRQRGYSVVLEERKCRDCILVNKAHTAIEYIKQAWREDEHFKVVVKGFLRSLLMTVTMMCIVAALAVFPNTSPSTISSLTV